MRLLPEQRQSMVGAVRRGFKKTLVADIFDVLTQLLEKLPQKPEKILTDNGPQLREIWKRWCNENHIEPLFAHPYYP